MTTGLVVAAAAALVAASLHSWMFVQESVRFSRPSTLAMLEVQPAHADAVRLWAYHQGVYNVLLGGLAAIGALLLATGATAAGTTLVGAASAAMVLAATALLLADRRRGRLPGFVGQALPPAIAVIALLTD